MQTATLKDTLTAWLDLEPLFMAKKKDSVSDLITVPPADRKIVDTLRLHKYNAVVAGGAALLWYQNHSVQNHDIDLWLKNDVDMLVAVSHLEKIGHLKISTKNAKTYIVTVDDKEYTVQLINKTRATVEETLNDFDITVCKIATDGYRWWIGPDFAQDLKTRTLRMMHFKSNSMRRFVKYVTYGYEPEPTLLERLMNDPVVSWDFSDQSHEDYADGL